MTSITDLKNQTTIGAATVAREPSPTLDKDSFLQLMVAKLQNQDPMNPQDDSQFVAQMAQMTSMEQMTNMSTTLTQNNAFNLIGKDVAYTDPGTGVVATGKVEKVVLTNGVPTLTINGVDGVAPSSITSVS
jgi:flagellar basal-body rod modification protein FlgD